MTNWVRFSEVKAHVSFRDVFSYYELLDGAEGEKNNELAICCPFHDSKNRLLKANTEKGVFKCFAPECDKKGNVIDFTAAMEGLPFRNAALGRMTSPAEQAFIDDGGYGAILRDLQAG